MAEHRRQLDGHSVNTFDLLLCEACGRAAEPPALRLPSLVNGSDVVRCSECREPLTLLECWPAGRHLVSGLWVTWLGDLSAT